MAQGLSPGGREVELFNEFFFRPLRARAGVPDDFLSSWSIDGLAAGGGKGGALMARLDDFIVKELSKGDHQTLLRITEGFCEHLRSGKSLLSPIFLHFRDKTTKRTFFAMRNCVGQGPFKALYDLKGCADDKMLEKDGQSIPAVHKRIWNVSMWSSCCWSSARRRYHSGKVEARKVQVPITSSQKDSFLEALRRDVSWLAGERLMDYSLLVAIKDVKPESTKGLPCGQPYIYQTPDGPVAVHMSIIDFLQRWTMGKRVARVVKVLEKSKATIPPRAYAARFAVHFTQHIVAVEDKASTDLNINGLMALSPKGPEEPLPDFHLEKAEESFHPVPVETVQRLEEPPMSPKNEDNRAMEMNNIEGPERGGACCGAGWFKVCV